MNLFSLAPCARFLPVRYCRRRPGETLQQVPAGSQISHLLVPALPDLPLWLLVGQGERSSLQLYPWLGYMNVFLKHSPALASGMATGRGVLAYWQAFW